VTFLLFSCHPQPLQTLVIGIDISTRFGLGLAAWLEPVNFKELEAAVLRFKDLKHLGFRGESDNDEVYTSAECCSDLDTRFIVAIRAKLPELNSRGLLKFYLQW